MSMDVWILVILSDPVITGKTKDFSFNFKPKRRELIICAADMILAFLTDVRNIWAKSSAHSSMYSKSRFSTILSTSAIGSLLTFLRRFLETLFSSHDST